MHVPNAVYFMIKSTEKSINLGLLMDYFLSLKRPPATLNFTWNGLCQNVADETKSA
jgi:hypothetical protein